MPDISFSCKDCVFAISENDKQSGCKLNRLKKLCQDEKPQEDGFFSFNRFCNTFRPQMWLDNHYDGNADMAAQEVYKEIYPRLSFIIEFDHNLDNLKSIISNIENQTIAHKKFVIVVNDKVEYNEDIFKLMQNTLKTNIGRFNVIQSLEESIELDEGFKHAKNGWSVFLKQGQNINTNFAEIIHNRINLEMKRFLYSENKDGTKIIVQSALYKLLNGNKPTPKQDGEMDTRSFKEKLQDMQQTDSDSVIEWERLFDE